MHSFYQDTLLDLYIYTNDIYSNKFESINLLIDVQLRACDYIQFNFFKFYTCYVLNTLISTLK